MRSVATLAVIWSVLTSQTALPAERHNLILFVPDGLRAAVVDPVTAPTFSRLRDEGVNFVNSHSLFPTFTTANASALATGHQLGDTGDYGNALYVPFPLASSGGTVTPFLEFDPVLREVNAHYGGNYLNEEALVALAKASGFSAALIGKLGPTAIFDLKALDGTGTLIVDDSTGQEAGVPVSAEWQAAFKRASVSLKAPGRGDNGNPGDNRNPGTWVPNWAQQQYFLEVTTKVVLREFKSAARPFVLVFWSRDPDGTQHNQGDSLDNVRIGINGPTSIAAIRAADSALAEIEQALNEYGLADSTNIVVAADHGFSTISKESTRSLAASKSYADTNRNELPVGFLAIDLAAALQRDDAAIKLFDPDIANSEVDWNDGAHPSKGNGLIGHRADAAQVVIASNGGSDLLYLPASVPPKQVRRLGEKLVRLLLDQDYVSGLFVDRERLGDMAGTLALSDIGLSGKALTPTPAIVVNFRSYSTGCETPLRCAVEVADTRLQQGQGMHGSFSRADTWSFMAARGPDFRARFVDDLPASNADVAITIARVLDLQLPSRGDLKGRVLNEALKDGGASPAARSPLSHEVLESRPSAKGLRTWLQTQHLDGVTYFDAAGFPGRTVGLDSPTLDRTSELSRK
jgi:arylsulfatase A-like enzyme